MKHHLILVNVRFAAIGIILCLAGCGGGIEHPAVTPLGIEEKVIVYSPHGKEILGDFKERFEAQYPGTVVDFLYLPSQQCLERVRNEHQNPLADVWWGAGHTTFMVAAKEGLLESYKPSWADQVSPAQHDPQDLWYPTFLSPEIIFYNSELISPENAPTDWEDLADPRYKDQILLRYPIPSDTMRAIFFGKIQQSVKLTGNEDDAFEWMLEVDRNVKEYLSGGELLFRKVAQRVGALSVWTLSDIMMQKSRYQYPFEVVFPESGCPVILDGIALIKGAQHPHAARAYYEFVTSTTSAIRLAGDPFYRIPARQGLPAESMPEWMRNLNYVSLSLDWGVYLERMNDWMRRWDEQVRGQGKKR